MQMIEKIMLLRNVFFGWWIVFAGFLVQTLNGCLLFHGFGAYVLPLQADFGWSRAQISGGFSLLRAESGFLGPLQGWLIDRYGPRGLMSVGFVLYSVGFLLLSRTDSLVSLYFSFAVIALGSSLGGFMCISTTITHWFIRRRSTALGVMLAGMGTGGLAVPGVVWCLAEYGWRNTAMVSGIVVLIVGLPLAQVMRRRPEDYGQLPDGAESSATTREVFGQEPAFTVAEALRTPAFWLLNLGHGAALLVVGTVLVHQIPHLVGGVGMSEAAAAVNVMILVVSTMFGQIIGGYLGDRLEKRRVMFGCMWLHALAMVIMADAASTTEARLFALVHGLAWGVRGTLINAIRADYFGRASYATISGFASMVIMIGMTCGPLLAGFLHDWTGDYRLAFKLLAGLVAFGSLSFLFARKPEFEAR